MLLRSNASEDGGTDSEAELIPLHDDPDYGLPSSPLPTPKPLRPTYPSREPLSVGGSSSSHTDATRQPPTPAAAECTTGFSWVHSLPDTSLVSATSLSRLLHTAVLSRCSDSPSMLPLRSVFFASVPTFALPLDLSSTVPLAVGSERRLHTYLRLNRPHGVPLTPAEPATSTILLKVYL